MAAAAEDDITHADGGGSTGSSSDAGAEAPGEHHPQHQHHPAIANGGQGVCPQMQHAGTAPSWSAADERHRAAHAHEEATARTADARCRAGTPVETQITSDEEAGTGGGGGGSSSSSAQQNNNGQGPQQQQQQQLTMMGGVHRSRAGSAASSTAGSGMGIGVAAAAEEMSVVLPETLRSVLEEVAKCGRSNRLPWAIGAGSAEEEIGEVPVPLPFGSLESRTKRKRPMPMPIPTHTATPSCTVDGGGEAVNGGMGHDDNVYECSHTAGSRKRPRPAPGRSNLAGGTTTYYDNDNDENAMETSAPHFRTLRNTLQVSLALVLDGAYRVCSERSGVGYRTSQAEREAWDRNKGRKRVDETDEGVAPNHIDEDTANGGIGSHTAIENGSPASDCIVVAGPARPVEAQEEDDEEKNSMAVSHSDLAKEMYLDRRTKLLAMLSDEHEDPGSRGRIKSRGALIPPEEYGPVEPPFTIQRICEILVAPTKYYSQTQKLCNALEKLLLIKSPEGFFGGAGAAGADEEDGRYESIPLPEEEELDFRKNAARESPMKMTGPSEAELPAQYLSQQQNEEYRRLIQEQRQNQSAALTSAASSALNGRFSFASSSTSDSIGQGLDPDRDSRLMAFGAGEHVGAEASMLDARSEQELRQTISSSLEGGGTEIAPGHLIARAPSPVLFADGTGASATYHRVIGMRGEGMGEAAAAAAARQQSTSGIRDRSGSVEAPEPMDFMVASRSRAAGLQRQQERGAPDAAVLKDVDGQATGHLSASNSEDGDVDDSMESGDDLSIDDSASDRSDRSDRSDGADSDTGSHVPSVAATGTGFPGTGFPGTGTGTGTGTGLSVPAVGTNLHAVGGSAPYGYEPFAAARVLALNRIHQQQQKQEQFLQSRALAAVAAGTHASASATTAAAPSVGQQSGLSGGIGLGAAHHHQHLGAHNNFRPPPDYEYQSSDSIDSTRAEDSCESDSSCASDMND